MMFIEIIEEDVWVWKQENIGENYRVITDAKTVPVSEFNDMTGEDILNLFERMNQEVDNELR